MEKKVRDFIRGELKVLLGLEIKKTEPSPAPKSDIFDPEEVKALRLWAGVLKTRPNLMNNSGNQASNPPQVNKATISASTTQPPTLKQAVAPSLPAVKAKPAETAKSAPKAKGRPRKVVEKEIEIGGKTFKVEIDTTTQVPADANAKGYIPPPKSIQEAEMQMSMAAQDRVAYMGNSGGSLTDVAIKHALTNNKE